MAAPRTPVTTQAVPAPAPAPAPKTQMASLPRTGSVTDRGQQQIIFAPGSAKLEGAGKATLAAIAKSLAQDPTRRVELRAYAKGTADNPSQARRLSLSRALAIRSALIAEGVKPTRIDVRALGNRVPSGVPNRVDLSVFTR
jgi:outer membrane protein OmpA-like peptidoglycan-associated protein